MAFIEKCGKEWRVRWREGGRGGTQGSSPRYATKHMAEEYLAQLSAKQEATRAPAGIPMTGLDLAERWRIHLRVSGRTAHYIMDGPDRVGAALGSRLLSQLEITELRAIPVGTRRLVKAALRWGRDELAIAVPDRCLRVPCGSAGRKPALDLMPDDVLASIQEAADRISGHMGAIVHLVSHYGHRPASLVKMTVKDITDFPPRLKLTVKGGDKIRHPIAPETLARLRASPPPFIDPGTGKPFLRGWDVARVYRSCLGRSRWKPEPGIYALKRRAISFMYAAGMDTATICSITGHRCGAALQRSYARTNEARQHIALAAIFPGSTTGAPIENRAI